MDLPRVQALQGYWRHSPPPHLQLLRIGYALGLKPEVPAGNHPEQIDTEPMQALTDALPTCAMPQVMSPEEYLRRKAEQHGQ